MILELAPDSSTAARVAAAALLSLHIGGGTVGIAAGMTALFAPKGSRVHAWAGTAFLISMLVMAAIGATVAPFLPRAEWGSSVMGAVTFYLVASAWLTVRRSEGRIGHAEHVLLMLGAAIAMYGVTAALTLANPLPNAPGGESRGAAFMGTALVTLAVIGDVRVVVRNGIRGAQRLVRHLWRMCVALLLASASLFLGQPQLFPEEIRGTFVLAIPELIVLVTMIFWLIRLRLRRRSPLIAAQAR